MHACASCSHDCRAALEQHDVCCLQQLLLLPCKPFVLGVLSVLRCSVLLFHVHINVPSRPAGGFCRPLHVQSTSPSPYRDPKQ